MENLLRKNVLARLKNQASNPDNEDNLIRFDDEENPFGSPLPQNYHQRNHGFDDVLKTQISMIKGIASENIFLGNSNYELVNALMSAFCEPKEDNIIICPPTVDYFSQIADLQGIETHQALLENGYQLDIESIAMMIDDNTKIIFLCSPNAPTGNALVYQDVEIILNNFDGLVVIDETFINYSRQKSFSSDLKNYPNLVILQNFDIAWAAAGVNVAMAFGSEKIMEILATTMPPHGVSRASLEIIAQSIAQIDQINQWIKDTVMLRQYLSEKLMKFNFVQKVYPSETNFIFVRFSVDVTPLSEYLSQNQIVVKNCHTITLCENCLKIKIQTFPNVEKLLKILEMYQV